MVINRRHYRTFVSPLRWAIVLFLIAAGNVSADELPNACPIDGCVVEITNIAPAGDELEITFDSNFKPDNDKNHFHVWWGDLYAVEQVGRGAEPEYNVTQGQWHRHDDYPVYITTGSASTSVREGTTKVCVTASNRDHMIIDTNIFHCVDAAEHLK